MRLGIRVKGSSLHWIPEWRAEVNVFLSTTVGEFFRLKSITDAAKLHPLEQ